MKLRIGSRDSALAVAQTRLVMDAIHAAHPEIELELVTMKTTGDKILDRTLDQVGGKGLFVKELDTALRTGRVDLTVHSCKDLPMEIPPDLPIAAFTRREDPYDALVLPAGASGPDPERPIGSASLRRRLQLAEIFPDTEVRPVRGNILTRLEKLDRGEYGALVLAAAGLRRLGLASRIFRTFAPEEMLPSAGQGILAVQCRAGTDTSFLDCVRDPLSEACAIAERTFAAALDGGCSAPAAAFAVTDGDTITITGMAAGDGGQIKKAAASGALSNGPKIAKKLADTLKEEKTCPEK